jgi:hypothetical protein
MFKVMCVVFAVWGVLVALKAVHALHTGGEYVFGMWDGGLIRVGKRLNKMGKQIKVATGAIMSAGCIALLTGIAPFMTAVYVIMFVGVLSVVSDFVTAD